MSQFNQVQWLKNKISRYKYLSLATLLLVQLAITLIHTPLASAAPTISSFPTTSQPGAMTVAGSDMFYLQGSTINSIGRMATSGAKTDYAIGLPSGATSFTVKPRIITGPDGNVWFFGSVSPGIRLGKLDISTGTITYYSLPCGESPSDIGTGPDGKIYFSCSTPGATGAGYLKSFDISTGVASDFWTFQPYSAIGNIITGADGMLYVSDNYHKDIFGFDTSGTGGVNFSSGSTSPSNLTNGPDGNLWFVRYTNKIVKASPNTGVLTEYSLPSGVVVNSATKLVAGPDGAVWFYNAGTSSDAKVGRITTSGIVTTYQLPVTGTIHYEYGGPVVGSDGAIWVNYFAAGYGGGLVRLTTAPSFTQLPISSTNNRPGFMTVAGGDIWYLYNSTNTIGRMTTSGVTTDYAMGLPSGATSFTVKKLITGPDGNVWFYGSVNPGLRLGKLDISTGTITYYSMPCTESSTDIGAGPDGKIYFSCSTPGATGAGYLKTFDLATGGISTFWTFQQYSTIGNIITGTDGRLYVTDSYTKSVTGFNIGTTGGVYFSTGSTSASNLTYGPDSNLWFVRPGNKIVKATTSGVLTEYDVSSSMVVDTSTKLAAGSDGAIYIYNVGYYGDRKVGRITTSGVLTTYQLPVTETLSYNRGGPLLGPDGAIWVTYYVNSTTQGLMRLGY